MSSALSHLPHQVGVKGIGPGSHAKPAPVANALDVIRVMGGANAMKHPEPSPMAAPAAMVNALGGQKWPLELALTGGVPRAGAGGMGGYVRIGRLHSRPITNGITNGIADAIAIADADATTKGSA